MRFLISAFMAASLALGVAASSASAKTFAEATAGLERRDGLAPIFVDHAAAKLFILLPSPDKEGLSARYLYQTYLRAGLGSNPVGLDRSAPGDTQILAFRKVGARVLAQFENYGFNAAHGAAEEKQAVAESFAISTVWSGDVVATSPDGGLLVDLSSFLTRDAMGIARRLKGADQGDFRQSSELSFVDAAGAKVFPKNLELEATETFVSDEPGDQVIGILPDPHHVTLVVHHALVALPESGFEPRIGDPRVGVFDHTVVDYSAPLSEPITYRLAHRFRLEKIDPSAARSRVKTPIIFYIDPSAPEPIRSALLEGARWWNQAFEAAGYIDAFRAELLPEGVSPLDARYNVVNWVHRQTRGWSSGHSVVDPRTGEIVKGDVLLGSQRIRQDRLIFEGLEGADKTGKGGPNDPIQISLARLRQLSTHEIGHSIGLQHNFAASGQGRASVMDYPVARIAIKGGELDFSDAYATGVGAWDRFAITWLYSSQPPGAAGRAALSNLASAAQDQGLRFVSDDDARGADTAQPLGAVWDDGDDPLAELSHVMAVRKIALSRFGLRNLPDGAAVSNLRRVLVPIYLFHRYQIDAAAKLIGGTDFTYAVKGDGHEAAKAVEPMRQAAAMDALIGVLSPAALDLPDPLLDLLSSGQAQSPDPQNDIEIFSTEPVFDLPWASTVIAARVWSDLFAPARLDRLIEANRRDPAQPGLQVLLDKALKAVQPDPGQTGRQRELSRRVRHRLVVTLAADLATPAVSPTAAAIIRSRLTAYGHALAQMSAAKTSGSDFADQAQAKYLSSLLLEESGERLAALAAKGRAALPTPPGSPIGESDWFDDVSGAR